MTRALVSGSNRGIGLALVRALAERGVFVFAGARRPNDAGELLNLQKTHSGRLEIISLDVTSGVSVERCAQTIQGTSGTLDILVNNAAVFLEETETPLAELGLDLLGPTFAVNVTGAVRVTQAMLPLLLRSKQGRIVNISSGAGSIGDRDSHRFYCYGASKAALNHFTAGLAHELRPKNIIVAAMSPGWVKTDMGGAEAELTADESASVLADSILKLTAHDTGQFLDRFGRKGKYGW